MMETLLSDPRWMDKDIIVEPLPYGNTDEVEIQGLSNMYGKFGFKPWRGNYMILERN